MRQLEVRLKPWESRQLRRLRDHATSARVVNAEGHVEVVEPAGADTYVVTRLGGREVIGRMRSDMQVAPHSTVPFAFNMDKAVYFDPKSELRIA